MSWSADSVADRNHLARRISDLERNAKDRRVDRDAFLARLIDRGEYLAGLRGGGESWDLRQVRTADLVAECIASLPDPSPELVDEIENRVRRRSALSTTDRLWLWIVVALAERPQDVTAHRVAFLAS